MFLKFNWCLVIVDYIYILYTSLKLITPLILWKDIHIGSQANETLLYIVTDWYMSGVHGTLLEKQSKFPRYNMKCRGKPYTAWNLPHSITFSPLNFMLYRRKSISFGTGYIVYTFPVVWCGIFWANEKSSQLKIWSGGSMVLWKLYLLELWTLYTPFSGQKLL